MCSRHQTSAIDLGLDLRRSLPGGRRQQWPSLPARMGLVPVAREMGGRRGTPSALRGAGSSRPRTPSRTYASWAASESRMRLGHRFAFRLEGSLSPTKPTMPTLGPEWATFWNFSEARHGWYEHRPGTGARATVPGRAPPQPPPGVEGRLLQWAIGKNRSKARATSQTQGSRLGAAERRRRPTGIRWRSGSSSVQSRLRRSVSSGYIFRASVRSRRRRASQSFPGDR